MLFQLLLQYRLFLFKSYLKLFFSYDKACSKDRQHNIEKRDHFIEKNKNKCLT
jgi:hypothetical protein